MNTEFHQCIIRGEEEIQAQNLEVAIKSFERAIEIHSGDLQVLLTLAFLYIHVGKHRRPIALVEMAERLPLSSPMLALQLLTLLVKLGKTDRVVRLVEALPPEKWDSVDSIAEVARLLQLANANELACRYSEFGANQEKSNLHCNYLASMLNLFFGRFETAAEYGERVLRLNAEDAATLWLMSKLPLSSSKAKVERIKSAIKARKDEDYSKVQLYFALHNEQEKLKNFDDAWDALEKGCSLMNRIAGYRSNYYRKLFDMLCSWETAEICSDDGFVQDDITPIFIVGLHRSGTTLIESILSTNQDIEGMGETYLIVDQIREQSDIHFSDVTCIEAVDKRSRYNYENMGRDYLKNASSRRNGKRIILDKLPSNYLNIGFIARALPAAKFIFVDRNPIDVGLSSLKTLFSHECTYSYSQDDFIEYYSHFEILMKHWKKLIPSRILSVKYEELILNTACIVKDMSEFCGITYTEEMLDIANRSRAISTESSVLIRDGLRTDRMSRWKRYADKLSPLIETFDK